MYVPPEEPEAKHSTAKKKRKALSREDAFKVIAGNDPRPLLVLRECKVCNGTDDALLKGGIDNERTFLLSRWFHCVKLPVDVLEEWSRKCITRKARAHWWDGGHGAPPSSTWSAAMHQPLSPSEPGPPASPRLHQKAMGASSL